MPLSGMLISRIEDGEKLKNAFEISGQSLSLSPRLKRQNAFPCIYASALGVFALSSRRWPV